MNVDSVGPWDCCYTTEDRLSSIATTFIQRSPNQPVNEIQTEPIGRFSEDVSMQHSRNKTWLALPRKLLSTSVFPNLNEQDRILNKKLLKLSLGWSFLSPPSYPVKTGRSYLRLRGAWPHISTETHPRWLCRFTGEMPAPHSPDDWTTTTWCKWRHIRRGLRFSSSSWNNWPHTVHWSSTAGLSRFQILICLANIKPKLQFYLFEL